MPNGSAGSLVAIQASRSFSPYSGTSGQTEIHLHMLGRLRTWYVSNQAEMRTPSKILLLAAFLVGSYYVRPAYDLIVVVAGRATDTVVNKTATQLARRDRQGVVERVIQQGDEITAYALTLRGIAKESATYRAIDFSSSDAYNQSSAALCRKFGKSLHTPRLGSNPPQRSQLRKPLSDRMRWLPTTNWKFLCCPGSTPLVYTSGPYQPRLATGSL